MTVIVKSKDELVVPRSVRRRAGIKSGDQVEFRVSGGIINIIPELPTADDEYTPARRRAIDARLAQARKGPYYGPFKTADEANAFLHKEIGNRKAPKRKTSYTMETVLSDRAIQALKNASPNVRRAFQKQLQFLAANLQHPPRQEVR